jgi:hypothetical protein
MEKVFLVLSSSVQAGRFGRSRRDQAGRIIETFEFVFNVPVELTAEMAETVADEIGNVLLVCKEKENDPGHFRIDAEATDRLVFDIAQTKLEAKAPLTPVQQRAIDLFSVGREKPAPETEPTKKEQSSQGEQEAAVINLDSSTENEADLTEEAGRRRGRPKKNP